VANFPQFRNLPPCNPTLPTSSGSPLPNFHLSFDSSTPNRALLTGTHAQTGFPLTSRKQTTVVLSNRYKKPPPGGVASWLPQRPTRSVSHRNTPETGFAVTLSKQTTVVLSNRNKKPPPVGVTTLQSRHSFLAPTISTRHIPEVEFVPTLSKQTACQFLLVTHSCLVRSGRLCGAKKKPWPPKRVFPRRRLIATRTDSHIAAKYLKFKGMPFSNRDSKRPHLVLFSLRPSFGYNGPYPAGLLESSQAERN
jgi:hypothetical protein